MYGFFVDSAPLFWHRFVIIEKLRRESGWPGAAPKAIIMPGRILQDADERWTTARRAAEAGLSDENIATLLNVSVDIVRRRREEDGWLSLAAHFRRVEEAEALVDRHLTAAHDATDDAMRSEQITPNFERIVRTTATLLKNVEKVREMKYPKSAATYDDERKRNDGDMRDLQHRARELKRKLERVIAAEDAAADRGRPEQS